MSVISTRCKEVFFRKHLRDHFQCSRSAVKDGYCKQHHPESRKALFIKNEARYNADILKRASTTDVRLSELELENAKLKAENAALREQWYTPVATLLPSDPYDERDGFWVNSKDKQRLAKLPAGTVLYANFIELPAGTVLYIREDKP